jgi:uncharacterized protein YecT (DUF1311 family)
MHAGNGHMWAVSLCASFVLAAIFPGQQGPASPKSGSTPEREAKRSSQAQAKQVFDAEMAREKAGDCPDAKSDYDFNVCYGKALTITNQNLKSFEGFIRQLVAPPPQMGGRPAIETNQRAIGIGRPVLASQEFDEFERVEQSWGQYREVACAAAFHQFEGGTGGPSFELECELKLARDHMRELNMIYGEALHQ